MKMDKAEIRMGFEPEEEKGLVWIIFNGKKVGALPADQLMRICQAGMSAAYGTYLQHILLRVNRKEEPIKYEAEFIPADGMPMPGDPDTVMAQDNEGIKYHAGFWQGTIIDRKFGSVIRTKTLDDMGRILHGWMQGYGNLKDDLKHEMDTVLDEAETIIKGSFG